MAETYLIQVVASVEARDGGWELRFHDGTRATLPVAHPNHDLFLFQAEESVRAGCPVGAVVDEAGRVRDMNHTYRSHVDRVRDDPEDGSRVEVWFWAFSPICYLTRDHPEFDRIHTTLAEAATSGELVWLANHCRAIEGETEIWHKLLDVRPAAAVAAMPERETAAATGRDANGAADRSRVSGELQPRSPD